MVVTFWMTIWGPSAAFQTQSPVTCRSPLAGGNKFENALSFLDDGSFDGGGDVLHRHSLVRILGRKTRRGDTGQHFFRGLLGSFWNRHVISCV